MRTLAPRTLLITTTAIAAVFGQPEVAAQSTADWIDLFDGKSFDGWHQAGGKHEYEVVDGMIVGTSVAKEGNAFMTTDATYKNFELKFEVKSDHPFNSGCQIRSVPVGPNGHLRGPQVEIAGGRSGFIYGEVMKKEDGSPQRWLSPNLEDEKSAPVKGAFKINQWNSFLIRVFDDHYQTYINDILITDFEFDGMTAAGHIGLQVHGVKKEQDVGKSVRWKNIFLKKLESKPQPAEDPTADAESAAVVVPLVNTDPPLFPYLATSEGREGYALAGEETNTYRVYDFYKRQAKHHLTQDTDLALLPAYPDLDGGSFGHWGNYSRNGHQDLRWNDMDYGPAVTASYSIDKKKKRGNMLTILLRSGQSLTFDKATGGYYNAWEGRPYFDPHRWGLIHGVKAPEGEQTVDLSLWFQPLSKDGKTISRYLGHHLYNRRVIQRYEIGETQFLESVSRMENGCYTRSISTTKAGSVDFPFTLEDHRDWDIKTAGNVFAAVKDGKAIVAAAKGFSKGQGSLLKPSLVNAKWTAPVSTNAYKLYYWEGMAEKVDSAVAAIKADNRVDPLQKWSQGGKPRWPQLFKEKVTIAKNNKPYVIDRISVPFDNPWGSMMMFSGIDFDQAGDAYITTLMGDVWKVSGLGEDMKEATWKRYATGLDQPFGIRLIDGLPYVMTRGSIVVLKDLNGDNEADYYEDYLNGFDYAVPAHTRTFGFPMDKDRTFYFVNGSGAYKKPWNKPVEFLASGLRNAMAVGGSSDGIFLVGPQEGVWTPSSAVLEIHKGDYYGMGSKLNSKESREEAYANLTPAMAYLPRGIDNSTGGFEFPKSDRFGPLDGSIIGLSYGYGSWFEILRNDSYTDYGRAQGSVVPLDGEFRAGVVRGAVHPGDGMFYVVGTDGWGNYAIDEASLDRIRYTGKTFPKLENVHGRENGIELKFSSKLLGNAAPESKNFFVQQWNYEYSPGYGSLEYSVRQPSSEGHDRLRVTRAKLLPDGKSIFLEIPNILPAMQTHIYGELETTEGKLEVNTFATLIHLDKAHKEFAAPESSLKSRTASLRMRTNNADGRSAAMTAFTIPDRIKAGESLYKMFCAGCHGPEGKGLLNISPTLHSDWVAGSPEVLIKVLLKGLSGEITVNGQVQNFEAPMPAFGDALSDNEIAAILTYLRKTWAKGSVLSKEMVKEVRAAEKGKTGPYEAKGLWGKTE